MYKGGDAAEEGGGQRECGQRSAVKRRSTAFVPATVRGSKTPACAPACDRRACSYRQLIKKCAYVAIRQAISSVSVYMQLTATM
jgi:hypothetical protein